MTKTFWNGVRHGGPETGRGPETGTDGSEQVWALWIIRKTETQPEYSRVTALINHEKIINVWNNIKLHQILLALIEIQAVKYKTFQKLSCNVYLKRNTHSGILCRQWKSLSLDQRRPTTLLSYLTMASRTCSDLRKMKNILNPSVIYTIFPLTQIHTELFYALKLFRDYISFLHMIDRMFFCSKQKS